MKLLKSNLLVYILILCSYMLCSCSIKPFVNIYYTPLLPSNNSENISLPSPGKTKVIFVWYREWKSAFANKIIDNGKVVGLNEIDSFFEYECEPGKHIFATTMEFKKYAFAEADLLPNHIYYVYTTSHLKII